MDDVYSIVVLAFVLWSVVGGLLGKKGKGGAHAPPRSRSPGEAPGRVAVPDREPAGSYRDVPDESDDYAPAPIGARGDAESDRSASAMIPDDLWEILTGERRRPAPEPAQEPEEWNRDSAWHGDEEDAPAAYGEASRPPRDGGWAPVPASRPERSRSRYGREAESLEVIRPPDHPVVVSMEGPPPPPERRHRAFHEKLEATRPAPRPVRRGSGQKGLRSRAALRRAVVLREVLGPPKALE